MSSNKYTVGEIVRVIIGATGTAEKYGGQEVTVIAQAEFAGAMVRVKAKDGHTFLLMDDEIASKPDTTPSAHYTIDKDGVTENVSPNEKPWTTGPPISKDVESMKVTVDNEEPQDNNFFPVITIHGEDYELASFGPTYSDGSRQATLRSLS